MFREHVLVYMNASTKQCLGWPHFQVSFCFLANFRMCTDNYSLRLCFHVAFLYFVVLQRIPDSLNLPGYIRPISLLRLVSSQTVICPLKSLLYDASYYVVVRVHTVFPLTWDWMTIIGCRSPIHCDDFVFQKFHFCSDILTLWLCFYHSVTVASNLLSPWLCATDIGFVSLIWFWRLFCSENFMCSLTWRLNEGTSYPTFMSGLMLVRASVSSWIWWLHKTFLTLCPPSLESAI